jgi:hypothetical protein
LIYDDPSTFHWSVTLTDHHGRLVSIATLASSTVIGEFVVVDSPVMAASVLGTSAERR